MILSFFSTFKIVSAEGWLSGWGKRVKLTIDQLDVDSDLSGFPVFIYLSTSSGRGPDDVSFVFDEIQSDSNRKKIAVTTSDGTTECYVEIERWDQASEKAWLWAKVPSVSGTVDTVLYLYYDRTHVDNTAYVGDTDSTAAESVWDTNHKGVWHLDEETNGTAVMKDSTSNNNDGTPRYGAVLGATGRSGRAVDIDGSNDYVYCPDSSSLDISGTQLTMSVWIAPDFDATRNANAITVDKRGGANAAAYRLFWKGSTDSEFDWGLRITAGGTDTNLFTTSVTWTVDTWHYLVGTYDGSNMRIYWDGVQENSLAKTGSISTSDYELGIAGYYEANPFDGTVDEVRISDYPRSAAWVKACYESERDHLIDYGVEGICSSSSFSAFADVDGVNIGTSETTLTTLATSFPAGNNFVMAIVQFESTASTNIATGNLKLVRGSTTLSSNQITMVIGSTSPHHQKWYALMALDSAPANPTYYVRATAAATGVSGEAKILAISGLTGASGQGSFTMIGTSPTTLYSLPTSLPAGDNIVVAIVESNNTISNKDYQIVACDLNLQSPSPGTLAGMQSMYYMVHDKTSNVGHWHVHLIPYLHLNAPANPTYNVTCTADTAGKIRAKATIVAFSKGSLSAAYSDGGDKVIGTSETMINQLDTSFEAGSEVAVIASEQYRRADLNYLNITSTKLQQNNASTGQATNEYKIALSTTVADNCKGFGLLNRFTSTPSSPKYEVWAQKSGTPVVSAEAKILAIAYKPSGTLLTFNSKYVITSTTAATTTSSSLVDDTYAIQDFSLTASQTILAIYQANSVYGASMPQAYGMQNAIRVDGTDYANSWDSGIGANHPVRNMVFWIGTLAAGSHTIKGRFATGFSGQTATVSNRVLLIYILNGDAYRYVDSSTDSTTSGTSFADDPEAQFTFTPPSACKALILYNVANYYSASQNENENGKKVAIWVGGTDYSQAEKSPYDDTYPGSVFTAWALSLSATSTTVKGRFACNIASSVYINRRQLGVLMFADSTLLDTVNSDTQVSTSSTSLVDDPQATISRTTSDARELLVVAMGTKRSGTSDSYNGSCYGIMVDGNDRANSRSSPKTSGATYAHSAATAYAENLVAGGHTIKGRFANNRGGTTKIDSRRIVALWLTCPPPLVPEFPFGALILVIPLMAVYVCLTRLLSPPNSKREL